MLNNYKCTESLNHTIVQFWVCKLYLYKYCCFKMSDFREKNCLVSDGWAIRYRRLIRNILHKSRLKQIKWKHHVLKSVHRVRNGSDPRDHCPSTLLDFKLKFNKRKWVFLLFMSSRYFKVFIIISSLIHELFGSNKVFFYKDLKHILY